MGAGPAVQVRWQPVAHNESYDDIGEMRCVVYLPDDLPSDAAPSGRSGWRGADLAPKLVRNARSLVGSAGG